MADLWVRKILTFFIIFIEVCFLLGLSVVNVYNELSYFILDLVCKTKPLLCLVINNYKNQSRKG